MTVEQNKTLEHCIRRALLALNAGKYDAQDTMVADLMADLIHYCEVLGIDFDAELARAREYAKVDGI